MRAEFAAPPARMTHLWLKFDALEPAVLRLIAPTLFLRGPAYLNTSMSSIKTFMQTNKPMVKRDVGGMGEDYFADCTTTSGMRGGRAAGAGRRTGQQRLPPAEPPHRLRRLRACGV